jgi:hypothetical protein
MSTEPSEMSTRQLRWLELCVYTFVGLTLGCACVSLFLWVSLFL